MVWQPCPLKRSKYFSAILSIAETATPFESWFNLNILWIAGAFMSFSMFLYIGFETVALHRLRRNVYSRNSPSHLISAAHAQLRFIKSQPIVFLSTPPVPLTRLDYLHPAFFCCHSGGDSQTVSDTNPIRSPPSSSRQRAQVCLPVQGDRGNLSLHYPSPPRNKSILVCTWILTDKGATSQGATSQGATSQGATSQGYYLREIFSGRVREKH